MNWVMSMIQSTRHLVLVLHFPVIEFCIMEDTEIRSRKIVSSEIYTIISPHMKKNHFLAIVLWLHIRTYLRHIYSVPLGFVRSNTNIRQLLRKSVKLFPTNYYQKN